MAMLLAMIASPAATARSTSRSLARPPTRGALYTDGQTDRYLLGGTWLYRADRTDVGIAEGWWRRGAGASGWSRVSVPNAYNARDLSLRSWEGYVGWYRRDFTLPAGAFAGYVPSGARRWIIRFESVSYRATIWLNGHLIGRHTGANLPFEFDLSGLRPGVNRLVVRVDNRPEAGDLPPGPGGGWWNYGGILREVYLRSVQRVDISRMEVQTQLPCLRCAARVTEQVTLRNPTSNAQTVRLSGRYGSAALRFGAHTLTPGASTVLSRSVRIARPRLWAPGHPALYRATLTLSDTAGRPLGGYLLLSGIRSIKVTRDGRLTLNGHLLDLRGTEMREQNLMSGAALSRPQLRELVRRVRSLGATLIRSDPLNPQIEEMADREGLLIWSDIPLGGHVSSVSAADALLADNVQTNEDHPSVLLWGVADELPTPATAGEASYIRSAVHVAHDLDPTRPVGMSITDWPGIPCQSAYAPLDVVGLNEYFGWYDAGGGATDDRDALSPFLDSLRACYPTKALFVTEFGFDGARNGPADVRGTFQFQAGAVAYHLRVFATKPWLSGAVYSLLADSVSGPTYKGGDPHPYPPFDLKGLLTITGKQKPAFRVASAIYHHTVQIAPRAR